MGYVAGLPSIPSYGEIAAPAFIESAAALVTASSEWIGDGADCGELWRWQAGELRERCARTDDPDAERFNKFPGSGGVFAKVVRSTVDRLAGLIGFARSRSGSRGWVYTSVISAPGWLPRIHRAGIVCAVLLVVLKWHSGH